MKIRFWGVRGSLPTPGPDTARYGGNTTCIQIIRDSGPVIVIDAGTGIRALGDQLMKTSKPPFDIKLLVTHTHWDHIHGFPFFVPIYTPGSKVEVMGIGPIREGKTFEQVMRDQMTYSYFPVENTMLDNVVSYQDYNQKFPNGVEKSFELCEGVKVTIKLTNHPVYCTAYRIEADGHSFIFTGDHEPWQAPEQKPGSPGDTRELYRIMNHRMTEFCRDVDLIAIDTTYTLGEYESKENPALSKKGWGHSYFEFNIGLAKQANVKRMAFTHHDPTRTDDALDRLMDETYLPLGKKEAPNTEFFAAREGMEIEL
ncbi:MAG: MBL fold metallo-hydrolase [Planctomycetes bacterium]|nr:MBL fold metallo-hydrolase [Planctomycetota bacterium]MCA8936035.1 MBL fold metallo-hydrolase [Planctomycetota bacterium]